jgi:hypothetical protein
MKLIAPPAAPSPEISDAGPFRNSTASRLAVSVIREVMFCGPILMPL